MDLYAKTVLFARRLSVFYLLVGIFSVFFGVYYYRYMPANQAELNTRGFRILNQLAKNVSAKNATLIDAFDNLSEWSRSPANKDSVASSERSILEQIKINVQFEVDSGRPNQELGTPLKEWKGDQLRLDTAKLNKALLDTLVSIIHQNHYTDSNKFEQQLRQSKLRAWLKDEGLRLRPDSMQYVKGEGWCLVYRLGGRKRALVKVGDFLEPVFAGRDDLFNSYVLLARSPSKGDSPRMKIVYLQNSFSPSSVLSMDSAVNLQKNTDLSNISDVVIGGQIYTLFFQSFEFGGSQLVLGGLISKADYDRQAKALPADFVASLVLVIFLGLMALPFIKVFFISPRESVSRADVVRVMLALYVGTVVLVLAGVYFLSGYSAHNRVEDRLKSISDSLEKDVSRDIRKAGLQLEAYASLVTQLRPQEKKVITYSNRNKDDSVRVDDLFSPTKYPLVARVMWFDSAGNTIAKWNPFKFLSPPSSLAGYPFYPALKRKEEDDFKPVFGAGESNITGEFQLSLARRVKEPFDVSVDTSKKGPTRSRPTKSLSPEPRYVNSLGIVMSFYLHSGLRSVLPKGFGFCLIDNRSMQVLMHSDPRRNLAENLFAETSNNPRLKNLVDYRSKDFISGVNLYGSSHTFYVQPVDGQDVSLVVFYDDCTHAENIFRMIHFGGEGMMYVLLLLVCCLLLSTVSHNKLSRLTFKLRVREWVRPAQENWRSYYFTCLYFFWMMVAATGFYLIVWLLKLDIRIPFYLAILMPFYALWGFVASRKSENPEFPADPPSDMGFRPRTLKQALADLVSNGKFVVLMLVCLNWLFFRLEIKGRMEEGWEVACGIIIPQVVFIFLLAMWYYRVFYKKDTNGVDGKRFVGGYIWSLCLSVPLVSLLPVLGMLWYGWVVEKVQFVRGDELWVAQQNTTHMKYVAREFLPEIKTCVLASAEADSPFKGRLLYQDSRYLHGERIDTTLYANWKEDLPCRDRDIDQPYIDFLDKYYVITAGEYNSYSVPAADADNSWAFISRFPDSIGLGQAVSLDSVTGIGISTDPMLKDFKIESSLESELFSFAGTGTFHLTLLLIAVAAFVIGVPKLLTLTVYRLFLLDFDRRGSPPESIYLASYFPDGRFPDEDFVREPGPVSVLMPVDRQEDYILETVLKHKVDFQLIWDGLPEDERYFLYDFANDGYTNYRDSEYLLILEKKGLLVHDDQDGQDRWRLFAISFREFILRKKGTPEIADLKAKFAVPGLWATIRIPSLIIILACALLLMMTQDSVSQRVTVAVTSLGAIVPIVLEITRKLGTKGAG